MAKQPTGYDPRFDFEGGNTRSECQFGGRSVPVERSALEVLRDIMIVVVLGFIITNYCGVALFKFLTAVVEASR
jgi:hypothetical protein